MPTLKLAAGGLAVVIAVVGTTACKKKVSSQQCDELINRFSELYVQEHAPDAGPDKIAEEKARVRQQAMVSDELKNCQSEVQVEEHACAMKATTSDAMLKCLE